MPDAHYVDLQVNGYAGVDFNVDALDAGQFEQACLAMQRDGVSRCLPTIITDSLDRMTARIARLVELARASDVARRLVAGIHVEGPFLSPLPGYRGAHPPDAITPASVDAAARLVDAGNGLIRLFTLAPEQDEHATVTRWLTDRGVLVSAGHTNASLDQLRRSTDAGLRLFTHLGNGCPMVGMDRHDNIIQRVLALASDWLIIPCFIADGVHVPFFALRNYIRLVGVDSCIVVTDAMAAAGLGPGRHRLGRWEVDVGADLAAWAPDRSHLVGSAMSMPRAQANLRNIGFSDADCIALLSDNATRLLDADR